MDVAMPEDAPLEKSYPQRKRKEIHARANDNTKHHKLHRHENFKQSYLHGLVGS